MEGAKHVKLYGRHVKVRAEVLEHREFSAHAGASELVEWVSQLDPKPETVFLVHGEPEAASALEERIEKELDLDAVVARHGEKVLLSEAYDHDEVDDLEPAAGEAQQGRIA